MEKAAERSAKVGEVRRLVAEGATLDAALLKAGDGGQKADNEVFGQQLQDCRENNDQNHQSDQ